MCGREKVGEFFSPLCEDGFRYNEHRLFDNAELPQFHGSRSHFCRLACTHGMSDQHIAAGADDALNDILLMLAQRLCGIRAVNGKRAPVIVRRHDAVELLVVELREVGAALLVVPQPALKFSLDFFGHFVCRDCGLLVDIVFSVLALVTDGNILVVEDGGKELQEAAVRRTPGLLIVNAVPRPIVGFNVKPADCAVVRYGNIFTPICIVEAGHVCRESAVNVVWYPRGAGNNADALIGNVRGHNLFECVNVVLPALVDGGHCLRFFELCTDIAGEIFGGGFKRAAARLERETAVYEHLPRFVRSDAAKLAYALGVNAARFVHGHGQRVGNAVRVRHRHVLGDGVLREQVRFGSGLCRTVVVFEGKNEVLVRVVLDYAFILLPVDRTELFEEVVIGCVQLRSCLPDLPGGRAGLFELQEFARAVAHIEHTGDARGVFFGKARLLHKGAVLVLEDLPALGDIPARLRAARRAHDRSVHLLMRRLCRVIHFAGDLRKRLSDLVSEVSVMRCKGKRFPAVHAPGERRVSEDHVRVLSEIVVFVFAAGSEVRIRRVDERLSCIRFSGVTLFQNENVRDDARAGVLRESRVRQSDCAEKVRAVREVLSEVVLVAVHCEPACDEHDEAAGADLVKRFGEEVIVDSARDIAGIALVRNSEIPKRNIRDRHVVEIVR